MSLTEHHVNGVIFDTAGPLSVGGVRHAFTTRHGGVSPAPFDSLNLASNRGDREENILENYRRLGAAVGFDTSRAVGCRQIHSDLVRGAREKLQMIRTSRDSFCERLSRKLASTAG